MFVHGRASGTFTVSRILLLFCRDTTRRVGTTTLIIILLLLLLYARYLSVAVEAVAEGQCRARPRYLLPTYFHLQLQYVARIVSDRPVSFENRVNNNIITVVRLAPHFEQLLSTTRASTTALARCGVNKINRHSKSARRLQLKLWRCAFADRHFYSQLPLVVPT